MLRYLLVAALFVLSLITYIDRAAISSAKGPISAELALSDEAMGAVFSAFALGYALAQAPAGWLADRYGPRIVLTVVVALWSGLTALTGAANSFLVLLTVRFFFGIAEAGAFPGAARAFFNWLPVSERGRANGIIFSGTRLGAAFAFPLMAILIDGWGWRVSFYWLALPGLIWAFLWFALFRDRPRIPPEPELATAASPEDAPSLSEILKSRRMALNMIQYFASNFTNFLPLSWILPYLQREYSLTLGEAARWAALPLLLGATAQWVAGFLVDYLYRTGWRDWSRRIPAMIGFALAVIGLLAVREAETAATASILFAIATFGADMTISPSWAYSMDLGKGRSGTVSGTMNMAGNLGSFVSANAFPWMYAAAGGAGAYFLVAALLNAIAIGCWIGMRPPERRIAQ